MNRYQRRKRALERKEAKAKRLLARALMLKQNTVKEALVDAKLRSRLLSRTDLTQREREILSFRKREPSLRGMRNATVWHQGLYLRGYGTGAFTERPLSERQLRAIRSGEKRDL